jgi:hypothetical protein
MSTKFKFDPEPILARVEDHEGQEREKLASIVKRAQALLEAARKVGDSWSGSCMGYHHELYYGDFEKPPLGDYFNVEWGGINGLPQGWAPRSPDEVKFKIEGFVGEQFSRLDEDDKELAQMNDHLRTEIVTELAWLSKEQNLEGEKELLKKLDGLRWGEDERKQYCAHAVKVTPHTTRDSSAIMAGFRLPSHIYYESLAHQALAHAVTTQEFWKTSRRLLKQLKSFGTAGLIESVAPAPVASLELVTTICQRFQLVVRQLRERHEKRPTLEIHDEYDVQDLLHALLRLHFDDIREEEWTPSYAGGSARMDFLLKAEEIVIEAKMTRKNRGAKEVADELIVDVARYKEHKDSKTLVCYIYDPEGTIKNPRGLERDLAKLSDSRLKVLVFISS